MVDVLLGSLVGLALGGVCMIHLARTIRLIESASERERRARRAGSGGGHGAPTRERVRANASANRPAARAPVRAAVIAAGRFRDRPSDAMGPA